METPLHYAARFASNHQKGLTFSGGRKQSLMLNLSREWTGGSVTVVNLLLQADCGTFSLADTGKVCTPPFFVSAV